MDAFSPIEQTLMVFRARGTVSNVSLIAMLMYFRLVWNLIERFQFNLLLDYQKPLCENDFYTFKFTQFQL